MEDNHDDLAPAEFADVLLDNPSRQLDRPFTYRVPEDLRGKVSAGSVVVVPFLHSHYVAYVLGPCDHPQRDGIKDIARVVDEPPVFNQEMVKLCAWMADRYITPLSQVFRLITPPGRGRTLDEEIRLKVGGEDDLERLPRQSQLQRLVLQSLQDAGGSAPLKSLRSEFPDKNLVSSLKRLEELGLIERVVHLSRPKVDKICVAFVHLEEAGRIWLAESDAGETELAGKAPTPLQRRALELLEERGGRVSQAELVEESAIGYPSLRSLAKRGLISIRQEEQQRDPFSHITFVKPPEIILNRDQDAALLKIHASIDEGTHRAFLLYGITSSGKTEVYLRAIRHVLELGKTAIVLVPEIALTPQMVERFKGALGETVAVLHSGLGLGERYDQWRGIRDGSYRVVIGARSALFAPLENLGLIVIDEEHETTYKEGSPPRYHAREVATFRASINDAVLVLGSATPQLETLYRARQGNLVNLSLPRRIDNRPLPRIEVVDMRETNQPGLRTILSTRLVNALVNIYESDEQAILFLNRRGFAPFLQCHSCGYIFHCGHCSVSLCFHLRRDALICHHCDASLSPPFICPDCGNESHRYAGVGTERVEEELRRLLPSIKCLRMDADTTRQKHSHWRILDDFKARKAHVLLGTQMIAKGLDIPTVTLVGVINADTSLALPDFRAAERTFQLLTQVSGRAGRGERPGRVIIQTFSPDNYAIEACVRGDDESFYLHELAWRREAGYPPFVQVVNLVFTSPREEAAQQAAHLMLELLERSTSPDEIDLLGPAAAPLSRLKGRYRYHLLLKARELPQAMLGIRSALPKYERARAGLCKQLGLKKEELSLIIDVDPTSLL
jgi:primosomal protein N' (replication factor Y)